MKEEKLHFYEVSDEYIEYLSEYDRRIMYSKVETRRFKRKYIGILLKINGVNYIAPLSSYKEKHDNMKDGVDFIKIGTKAVINLNNMFPVLLNELSRVLHNQVVKYNMPIRKRCCDFKKLELKCIEYKERKEK